MKGVRILGWLWFCVTTIVFLLAKLLSKFSHLDKAWALKQRLIPLKYSGELWVHGASLGECKAMARFLEKSFPDRKLLFTTQTKVGLDFLHNQNKAHWQVRLMPLDVPWLFGDLQCKLLLLSEGDYWPNALKAVTKGKGQTWVLGALKPKSILAQKKLWHSFAFQHIHRVFPQSQLSEGFWKTTRVSIEERLYWKLPKMEVIRSGYSPRKKWVSLLSIHKKEWSWVWKEGVQKNYSFEKNWIVVPRYPNEFASFQNFFQNWGIPHTIWPECEEGKVCLVLEMGQVGKVIDQSKLCWVGGGFLESKLHNFWEPLLHGVPCWVGKNLGEQQELFEEMERQKILRVIDDHWPKLNGWELEEISNSQWNWLKELEKQNVQHEDSVKKKIQTHF